MEGTKNNPWHLVLALPWNGGGNQTSHEGGGDEVIIEFSGFAKVWGLVSSSVNQVRSAGRYRLLISKRLRTETCCKERQGEIRSLWSIIDSYQRKAETWSSITKCPNYLG